MSACSTWYHMICSWFGTRSGCAVQNRDHWIETSHTGYITYFQLSKTERLRLQSDLAHARTVESRLFFSAILKSQGVRLAECMLITETFICVNSFITKMNLCHHVQQSHSELCNLFSYLSVVACLVGEKTFQEHYI